MTEVTVEKISAYYLPIPLVDPFVLSLRSATNANLVRYELQCSNGKTYLGESVPVQYVTGETVESVLALVPAIESKMIGAAIEAPEVMMAGLQSLLVNDPAARAGIEIALSNAYSDIEGTSLWQMLGAHSRELVTDVTLSKVENVVEVASRYYTEGFRIFKLKVGSKDVRDDINRILELRKKFPDTTMRLDANQAFDQESALRFISALEKEKIFVEMIEQPVPKEAIDQLAFVAERSPFPIIADEACRTIADAEAILQTAVHGVNVKVMKCGLYQSVAIAKLAKASNTKLMMGCMLESTVGIAAGASIAAGLGGFDYIDLDGHFLLAERPESEQFSSVGPLIRMAG